MRARRLKPLRAITSAVPAQLLETTSTSWVGLPLALAIGCPATAVAGRAAAAPTSSAVAMIRAGVLVINGTAA